MVTDHAPLALEFAARSAADPRFWGRTKVEGECIVWTGYRDAQGYGFVTRHAISKSPMLTHRYSWMLANGPIPEGAVIMHVCDRPPCVRLEHLRLGTQIENIADRERKGRGNPGKLTGEDHPQRKFHRALQAEARQSARLRDALEHLLDAAGPFAAIDTLGNSLPVPEDAYHELDEAIEHATAALEWEDAA